MPPRKPSAKKKSKKSKKSAPTPRRTPWHEAFTGSIREAVLVPTLRALVKNHEPAANAGSAAQLHAIFENLNNCSIPRHLFDDVCKGAGIVFSRGISLLTATPYPATERLGQIAHAPITDGHGAELIVPPAQPEGDDDVRFTNDDEPASPVADAALVREQALLHDAMNEANGLPPEPVIIPTR